MSTEFERREAVEDFSCSLAELTVNSKPHINFLTMVAEENSSQAEEIAKAVQDHLSKVPCIVKLPILYLIDSIMKNVGKDYIKLFTPILLECFANIYAEADKATRRLMEKLRRTWSEIILSEDLSTLDVQIHAMDPDWRLTAQSLVALKNTQLKILLNPNFLPQVAEKSQEQKPAQSVETAEVDEAVVLREQLLLQKKMRELEKEKKQVDLQLSKMKEKLIIVSNIKNCDLDTSCIGKATDEISNESIIVDEKATEVQADSTTVDKASNVPLQDSNLNVSTAVSASDEVSVSGKQLNVDLLQLLTDLIAKQNVKFKNEEESQRKFQENRHQYREHGKVYSSDWSMYSGSRSYRSSYHRNRKLSGYHRDRSRRDERERHKYHHKKAEICYYEHEHDSTMRDPRYQSLPQSCSTIEKKSGLQHCDKQELTGSSIIIDLLNVPVKTPESVPDQGSSQLDNVVYTHLSQKPKDNYSNNSSCISPKRKLESPGQEVASQNKSFRINRRSIEEPILPTFEKNANNTLSKIKQPLLPTPNYGPSATRLESFSYVQSHEHLTSGNTENEGNSITFCRNPEKLSNTQSKESLFAPIPLSQFETYPVEIQLQREIDYNHGFKCPENKKLVENGSASFQSRNEQPLNFLPPTKNNLGPSIRICSFSKEYSQEPRQNCYTKASQEHFVEEDFCASTGVIQSFEIEDTLVSLPPASHFLLEKIAQDTMKTILVDNATKEVRFYGEIALINSGENDPREISFKPGEASVIVNSVAVVCAFHKPEKEVATGGRIFRIRLGAPTRELYVNDEGFQCPFNCPPKIIQLSTGEVLAVQLLSNPPPLVQIGAERHDLVAGHVVLSVNTVTSVRIFLDAKPQRFDIDGVPHILKFADALQTVLVNDSPVNMPFGGPAIVINVNNTKHYVELSGLPPGIIPGRVCVTSMACVKNKQYLVGPRPMGLAVTHQPAERPFCFQNSKQSARKARGKGKKRFKTNTWKTTSEFIEQGTAFMDPAFSEKSYHCGRNVRVTQPNINVHALFQSLCNVGLLTPQGIDSPLESMSANLRTYTVDFTKPATLKQKQCGILEILYSGLQCSSCGLRFSPEHSAVYRQHLDWHFHQNHKLKSCVGKFCSRKWYCKKVLWIHFGEAADKLQSEDVLVSDKHETNAIKESSVPSHEHPQGIVCELCGDKFEEFFHEDEDEWHLRNCVSHQGLVYHPICLNDDLISKASGATQGTEERDNANVCPTTYVREDEASEECAKTNCESRDILAREVGHDNEQIATNTKKDAENSLSHSDILLDQTPKQDISQRPGKASMENGLSDNISCKENECPQGESMLSACRVPEEKSSIHDLFEINDIQAMNAQCVYSCVKAATSVLPRAKQVDLSINSSVLCDESIVELDATTSNKTITNLLYPTEPSSTETELRFKAKLIGRKLSQLPPIMKGSETSNLCSLS